MSDRRSLHTPRPAFDVARADGGVDHYMLLDDGGWDRTSYPGGGASADGGSHDPAECAGCQQYRAGVRWAGVRSIQGIPVLLRLCWACAGALVVAGLLGRARRR